ncbi:methyltransferase, FkbM family protein [Coleofasciculus chthonoplastes PCC 7420]|uniref:Methyltransferase, FkbM family protein n=1 Tax=Coleofasciculus chthonoplastes PCC 7420 TaxID=118168 RepID=B4VMI3_9CYAN|nr:FkbM family methyltransferase [Coleofasciculus chthonoplastes]EDX76737.1 methyltransferase, FkbM family protein [Coleofasciculus chthonoplastes PCC 7420]
MLNLHQSSANLLTRLQRRIKLEYNQGLKPKLLLKYRQFKKPKVLEYEGIKICLNSHISDDVLNDIYAGYYEQNELRIVKAKLTPNDIVMEIGTGIGLLSSYCAKRIGSERVFTFEANPELELPIRQNYAINQVSPHLEICLIGEREGTHQFYIEKNFWSSSTIQRHPDAKAIQVTVKSFNQEIKRLNPTFLIIDIEGGEYELLNYAHFHNVKKLVIELHERIIGREKVEFVKAKLHQWGFKIHPKISTTEELFLERQL